MQMSKWSRNIEGYADSTAGIAIGRVSREERKTAMAKKRSCRRTDSENRIHEKAVRMRKMTDEQLIQYVEEQVQKARDDGFNRGKEQKQAEPQIDAVDFVEEISRLDGIGEVTMSKIRRLLDRRLAGEMDA